MRNESIRQEVGSSFTIQLTSGLKEAETALLTIQTKDDSVQCLNLQLQMCPRRLQRSRFQHVRK